MPPAPVDPDFLTVAEVAQTLRVSEKTVYRRCDDGEIPCVLVGAQRRIPRRVIDDLLAKAETEAAERRSEVEAADHA